MSVSNVEYLERFLEDVDRVSEGSLGSITEDRWLINNYNLDRLQIILPYLKFRDPNVRAEVVTFLGDVRERSVRDTIIRMRDSEGDKVSMACIGYLTTIRDDDEAIPALIDIMRHDNGNEFFRAARRLAGIARTKDLADVRRIYGQVNGSMRDEVRTIMERIIDRDPSLESKRDLILSIPIYPDEASFETFLDSSIEYLDVRYRKSVLPNERIKSTTYNNIARAIRSMRIRLYNEADNLQFYGPDKEDRFDELSGLMRWANEDLARKKVMIVEDPGKQRTCRRCGNMMSCFKGIWSCPDCGGEE